MLFCIFFHKPAFDEAHGQHKEGNMVAGLGGAFQISHIRIRFYLRKVNAGKLILCLGVAGKSGIAQVLCALGSIAGLKGSGSEFVFLLSVHYLA